MTPEIKGLVYIQDTPKIVDELYIYIYQQYHELYWNTIANYGMNSKPSIFSPSERNYIRDDCFACEFASKMRMKTHTFGYLRLCNFCPIRDFQENHRGIEPVCDDIPGPYQDWVQTRKPEDAERVAELEWLSKEEYIQLLKRIEEKYG